MCSILLWLIASPATTSATSAHRAGRRARRRGEATVTIATRRSRKCPIVIFPLSLAADIPSGRSVIAGLILLEYGTILLLPVVWSYRFYISVSIGSAGTSRLDILQIIIGFVRLQSELIFLRGRILNSIVASCTKFGAGRSTFDTIRSTIRIVSSGMLTIGIGLLGVVVVVMYHSRIATPTVIAAPAIRISPTHTDSIGIVERIIVVAPIPIISGVITAPSDMATVVEPWIVPRIVVPAGERWIP